MDTAPKVMGCPPNFLRLKQFFGSKTALANALGVHRGTISKWDRGQASRLRQSSIERVGMMSAVAEQVARFMPTDASVGPWLLQPQPALGGEAPAHLIHRDGIEAYELILQKAAAIAEPVSVGDLGGLLDDDLRAEEERSGTSVVSQDSHGDRLPDPSARRGEF
jgi:hypothetical protein